MVDRATSGSGSDFSSAPSWMCWVSACSRFSAELIYRQKLEEHGYKEMIQLHVCHSSEHHLRPTWIHLSLLTSIPSFIYWSDWSLHYCIWQENWSRYHFRLFWIISCHYYFTIFYYFNCVVSNEKNKQKHISQFFSQEKRKRFIEEPGKKEIKM